MLGLFRTASGLWPGCALRRRQRWVAPSPGTICSAFSSSGSLKCWDRKKLVVYPGVLQCWLRETQLDMDHHQTGQLPGCDVLRGWWGNAWVPAVAGWHSGLSQHAATLAIPTQQGHTDSAAHRTSGHRPRSLLGRWEVGLSLGAGADLCWCQTTQVNSKDTHTTDLPTLKNQKKERWGWSAGGWVLLRQQGSEGLGWGSVEKHSG